MLQKVKLYYIIEYIRHSLSINQGKKMGLKKIFGHWDKTVISVTNFNGIWRNELNSQMTIHVDESGRVSGVYQVGSTDGISEVTHPLVGFANGDLICFTVDFEHQRMVCSWSGHIVQEQNSTFIKTQWNLVKHNERQEFSMETWGATHCGSNSFKRVG